jgi:hypothetical protein
MKDIKKTSPRVRLTHFEIRRGDRLRLRIAIADDAVAEVGDELGALIKKIAPGTRTTVVQAPLPVEAPAEVSADAETILISPQHDPNDPVYHATLRGRFTELFSSLCDTALADVLEIAREERARRAEGGN